MLATAWEFVEPNTWRFTLRQGVKVHNGETFDADDVVFSYQRTNTPGSLVKGNLSDIKDVRKVDAYTVDVETRGPLPTVANALIQLLIMDKGWSEANRATDITRGTSGVQKVVRVLEVITEEELQRTLPQEPPKPTSPAPKS